MSWSFTSERDRVRKPRTAGFRISAIDVAFIIGCGIGAWLLRGTLGEIVWGIPFAVGHFFLFCNVFRLRRSYELVWTAVFLVSFAAWSAGGAFAWWKVLVLQIPMTLAVIVAELRSPTYHGIWSRSINARHIQRYLKDDLD